jgi:hypothetical protein
MKKRKKGNSINVFPVACFFWFCSVGFLCLSIYGLITRWGSDIGWGIFGGMLGCSILVFLAGLMFFRNRN